MKEERKKERKKVIRDVDRNGPKITDDLLWPSFPPAKACQMLSVCDAREGLPGFIHPRVLGIPTITFQ